MIFDKKEEFLIKQYCKRFINRTFNEEDVFSFFILIRDHLDTSKFHYLPDFANLIAHRHRSKGLASNAIIGAINNEYKITPKTNKVIGYKGLLYSTWSNEWETLGNELGIKLNKESIFEITLCALSILQFTTHYKENAEKSGTIFLLQSDNQKLIAASLENGKSEPFIGYFILEHINFKKKYPLLLIDDPVFAIRNEEGVLELRNQYGERIV